MHNCNVSYMIRVAVFLPHILNLQVARQLKAREYFMLVSSVCEQACHNMLGGHAWCKLAVMALLKVVFDSGQSFRCSFCNIQVLLK